MKTKHIRFTRSAAFWPKIVSLLTPKKRNIALVAPLVFAAAFSAPAQAGYQTIRLNGWASVGGDCEATFTRNPAVIKNVDNIYIKVFGPIGTVPDPGRWYVHSPTLIMAYSLYFGQFHTNYLSGNEYWDSNTVYHNGPFVSGTWTLVLTNLSNVPCADYDNIVKVVFTLS